MESKKQEITEQEILKRFEEYKQQLFDDPKVSASKFKNMEIALLGCRYIINDCFGSPRQRRNRMG